MKPDIDNLFTALLGDFDRPDFWWQIIVLALCVGLAALANRLLRDKRAPVDTSASLSRRLGRGGINRLAFPLMALLLIVAARALLRGWHPVNMLSIAIPLLVSLTIIRAVFYVLRYSFNPSGWVASLERTLALLIWLVVALHIVGLLPHVIELLESISFSIGKQKLNLWLIAQGLVAVVLTLLAALWLSGLVDTRIMRAQGMDNNLRVVFSRLSRALLITLAVLVALPMVGLDLTTLSVFGGALGVGLGFGMQKIASNYVAGFIILLDRSIRIGNTISVGGQRGKVSRITTRYTVLRNAEGSEAIVPNEVLIGSTVISEPYTDTRMKVTLRVRTTYASDIERAMRIMEEVAAAQKQVLSTPAPLATAVEFTDVGVFIELACWIIEPEQGGWQQLRSDIGIDIWKAFKAADIELH